MEYEIGSVLSKDIEMNSCYSKFMLLIYMYSKNQQAFFETYFLIFAKIFNT